MSNVFLPGFTVKENFFFNPWGDWSDALGSVLFMKLSDRETTCSPTMVKEVAKKLDISMNTVLTYVRRIYKKLHVNSRHAAVERFKKMR